MSAGTQASADRRGLFSAIILGSSIGLGLGVTYLLAGLGTATAEHFRALRIAGESRGALTEMMLRRSISGLDPAAAALVRAYDRTASADGASDPAQAWPGRFGARFPAGRHASALDDQRDLDCLTEAVYFEARGETARGQAAVAQVVMNRLANPHFPKTVCAVVFQGAANRYCQFTFACDGSMRHGLELAAWDRARKIAERALAGVRLADIGGATHYHTLDVQPGWGPQMLRVAQVGLHVFYRLNPHVPMAREAEVEQVVLTGMPASPMANLRLASAIVEKAADTALAAPAEAEPAKAAEQPAPPKVAEGVSPPPSAGEPAAS